MKKIIKRTKIISIFILLLFTISCNGEISNNTFLSFNENIEIDLDKSSIDNNYVKEENKKDELIEDKEIVVEKSEEINTDINEGNNIFENYTIITVDGGDTNPYRLPNVAVNVGFGDREYWAFTNENSQLVKVYAKKIILQNDDTEPVNKDGRYYSQIASVPGTEDSKLDRGHVIADSLGGVANAYNITPQNSTLNRNGDQAYMEKVIRDANGCTDFTATIIYPNNDTQIPSKYIFEYTLMGNRIKDEFYNESPEKDLENNSEQSSNNQNNYTINNLSKIDTNNNGIVTISEAKAAGFKMPIYKTHWLYQFMIDGNDNGMVGE